MWYEEAKEVEDELWDWQRVFWFRSSSQTSTLGKDLPLGASTSRTFSLYSYERVMSYSVEPVL